MNRTIGPVTTAASGGAALAAIVCWVISQFAHIDVPPEIQGSVGIVFVILAGWAVKPHPAVVITAGTGDHTATVPAA